MVNRILILFAHPRYEKSLNNAGLLKSFPDSSDITIHDLYERYPDFNIDLDHEKDLLTSHNIIIWHHPFYWYSAPPLLKQWIDMVLEFGWAYGPGGTQLKGKIIFNAITTGGQRSAYSKEGYNRFTIKELLAPYEQTAHLCKMTYLPPFVLHGTHRLTKEEATRAAIQYNQLIKHLHEGGFSTEDIQRFAYLNDWIDEQMN
jgi:glutathione-regulated potassium-efflux system ancillary protein KefG